MLITGTSQTNATSANVLMQVRHYQNVPPYKWSLIMTSPAFVTLQLQLNYDISSICHSTACSSYHSDSHRVAGARVGVVCVVETTESCNFWRVCIQPIIYLKHGNGCKGDAMIKYCKHTWISIHKIRPVGVGTLCMIPYLFHDCHCPHRVRRG